MHLFAANERHICFHRTNACTVTLAIVAVKRLVSVHADDVGVWRMRFLLKMHMFLVAAALTRRELFVEGMLVLLLLRWAFASWRRVLVCRSA